MTPALGQPIRPEYEKFLLRYKATAMLIWVLIACELAATAQEQQRSVLERRSTAHQAGSGVQWYELGAGLTVVLVHGFGDLGVSWLSVAASLSETHRVVIDRSARPRSMDFAGMQAGLQDAASRT